MKKSIQNIAGYMLGGVMFVVLLPTIMWLASGMPDMAVHIGALRASLTGLLMLGGLTLSVWTIIYMKRRGKGNPMDAFGHEVAPRTQHLMTDGPYRINRNPMLTGTLVYLASFIVWLWTWQAVLVWFIFLAIMFVQVLTEEKPRRNVSVRILAKNTSLISVAQGGSYHGHVKNELFHLCGRPSFANCRQTASETSPFALPQGTCRDFRRHEPRSTPY